MTTMKQRIFNTRTKALFIASCCLCSTLAAHSADISNNEDKAKRKNRLIEEVIVTAQKREENLSDVPISITAYSQEILDAKGVLDAQDLPLITPGLTLSTSVNFLTVFIRGIGSDAFLTADPSIASYVDGIYFPFSNGAVQDFGAVERIEVLKGPQGTLFGRNAVGGAIHVITKSPNLNESEVSLQSIIDESAAMSSRAHVSVPLIEETLAASLSAIYSHGDNYIDGTSGGKPLQKDETQGARLKLRWSPTDWLEANLAYLKIKQRGVGSSYMPNSQPSPLGTVIGIQPQDPYTGKANEELHFFHENETIYGQIDFYLDPFDVRVIAGKQDLLSYSTLDFDGSAQPLVYFEIQPGGAKVDSVELQLLSNDSSWGSEWMKWIVGAYYFDSETGFPNGYGRLAGTDLDDGTLLGIQVPPSVLGLVENITGGLPLPTGQVDFVGVVDTNSLAYFSQFTVSLTDWLDLTLGGRYQKDERYIIESSSGLRTSSGNNIPLLHFSGLDDPQWRDKRSSFKPKISLEARPSSGWIGEEPLLYATWQQAIKGSAYNVVNLIDDPEYVEAEEMDAYEIGLKTSFFDQNLTLNMAVFLYQLENPQVQFVSLLEGGVISFENAGASEVKGFEIDGLAQLFPSSTENLIFTFSASFLDAEYTDYKNGTGFDPSTGLLRSKSFDFSGNKIVRSPDFSTNIGLSKAFNFDNGQLEIAGDYFYTTELHFLAQNSDFGLQEAYGVANLRTSYLYYPWNLRVSLFGKNILDEEYSTSLVLTDFGRNEARARKSQYGLRINWDF